MSWLPGHYLVLPVYNQHFLFGQQQIAVIIAKVIRVALPGLVLVGIVAEIKALQHQVFLAVVVLPKGLSIYFLPFTLPGAVAIAELQT